MESFVFRIPNQNKTNEKMISQKQSRMVVAKHWSENGEKKLGYKISVIKKIKKGFKMNWKVKRSEGNIRCWC